MFAELIFRQWKGAATVQPDPMPAWQRVQAGPGREAVVCQSKHWLPRFPGSSQHIPSDGTHCASPWRLSVIASHVRYQSQQHCWLCQGLWTYFYLPKTNTGQNKGIPIHLLLSGFPYLTAIPSSVLPAICAWGSDQLPHCLNSEACNYLCFCICCLWYQLLHNLTPSIFLGVETSFLSFSPASFSLQFLSENCSSVLSTALSPLFLLYFLSWQLCLVLWPTSLQFSHQAMPSVLMVSIGKLMAFSPSHPSAF